MKNFNLLIIFFLSFLPFYYIYNLNYKKIVKLPFINININKDLFKKEEKTITLSNNYLGYIEIDKYNIKNYIKQGTSDYILNQNVVGIHDASTSLDSKTGNLILAGHNNKNVFKNLIKVKLNDLIKVVSLEKEYIYKVVKIDYIKSNNFSYFDYVYDYKKLTLITCLSKDKRLIVVSYLME